VIPAAAHLEERVIAGERAILEALRSIGA
jgi:hypothetical protein